jgi:hypothetical protein
MSLAPKPSVAFIPEILGSNTFSQIGFIYNKLESEHGKEIAKAFGSLQ